MKFLVDQQLPRRLAAWITLLVAAILVSGCANGSDVASASAVSERFSVALDEGNINAAYQMLTPDLRSDLTQAQFAQMIRNTRARVGDCGRRPVQFRFERAEGGAGQFITIAVRRDCARGWMEEWTQVKISDPAAQIAGFGFTGPGVGIESGE